MAWAGGRRDWTESERESCYVFREREEQKMKAQRGWKRGFEGTEIFKYFHVKFPFFLIFSSQNPNQNSLPESSVFSPFYRQQMLPLQVVGQWRRQQAFRRWAGDWSAAKAGGLSAARAVAGRHALHAFGRDNYNLVPHFVFVRIAPPIGFKIYDFVQLYPCGNSRY